MFDLTSGNGMIQAMDRGLTLASKRQTLIASNLANLDTPGYRTRDFSFEGAMKAAIDGQLSPNSMATTHPMHLQGSTNLSHPPTTDALQPNAEQLYRWGANLITELAQIRIPKEPVHISLPETPVYRKAVQTGMEVRV